jgi:hypothetical protein
MCAPWLAVDPLARAGGEDIPEWIQAVNAQKPDAIMIGNSMQGEGIDFRALSKDSGLKVMSMNTGAAMTAWQHGIMKNVIAKADVKPKYVILVERGNNYTCPQRRAGEGPDRDAIEKVTGPDRSLLEQLVVKAEGQPKIGAPDFEDYFWDFDKSVGTSFLPDMLQLAKESGYKLILVRHKSRANADNPLWETPRLKEYGDKLAAWCRDNNVVFLDYSNHPDLRPEHYASGDHLSRKTGRPIWTAMMAADLKAVAAGTAAPNQRLPGDAKAVQPAPAAK